MHKKPIVSAAISNDLPELQQKSQQLSIINRFSLSLIEINELDELFHYVTTEVVSQLGFVDCVIYLCDYSRQVLTQVAARGDKSADEDYIIAQQQIPLNAGITGYVAKTGLPLLIDDVSNDPRYLADSRPALSELCVPLIYNHQVLGVIDCEHPLTHYFTDEHLEILTTVASMLSAKINQCHTLIDLKETVLQLNQAQTLEKGMLQIASLTYESADVDLFYQDLHHIVKSLINAQNLFIALYEKKTGILEIPYIVEAGVRNTAQKRFNTKQFSNTASVYLIKSNRSMLLNQADYLSHIEQGHFELVGGLPHSWLGVPFEVNNAYNGIVVVQSYDEQYQYTQHDLDILTYISRQISLAINRELARQSLEHKVMHDELTGLANRALLIDRFNQAISRFSRQSNHSMHALLYLDFDRFKIINDTLGHQVGDKFLIEICTIIQSCIRQIDTLARLGGDEFAILVEDIQSTHEVESLVKRIQKALEDPIEIDGNLLQGSTSIGVAFACHETDIAYKILQRADAAMYEAKSLGRGQVQFFSESMRQKLKGAALLETDIQRAIQHNEFELYYQPIFRIADGSVAAFEALVRWHHPDKGFVTPDSFIPVAEDSGLIMQLDLHLLEQAAKQLQCWQKTIKTPFRITVNVSSRHFANLDFVSFIDNLYQSYQLKPGSLCIEITESGLIANLSLATKIIEGLAPHQVKLCLDDFGTGYSALGYLHQLPIHVLKIDKSFIDNLKDGKNNPLVEAILTLAVSLELDVVAEGIEQQSQLDVLKQTNCDYGQGFLVAKPMPAAEAILYLNEHK